MLFRSTINYIKKDGVPESYTNKEEDNFWKIYIGNKDEYLENKSYQYEISYSTPYQIGYFDNYDELYWNVTGNGWDIPIENASCKLYLPSNNRFLNEKITINAEGNIFKHGLLRTLPLTRKDQNGQFICSQQQPRR